MVEQLDDQKVNALMARALRALLILPAQLIGLL